MPLYELGLVLDTELDAEARDSFLAELRAILAAHQAEIVKEDAWGKRGLAYEIRHKRDGYYLFWQFEGPGALLKPLEYKLRLSDQVLRYLTLNLDRELRRKRKLDVMRAEQKARKRRQEAAAAAAEGGQA